jgi:hypothetical protein
MQEAEYCRRQAERMRTLAKQCIDRNIHDQVETIAKTWIDRAVAREDRWKGAMANEWLARAAAKEPHQERRDVR